MTDISKEAVDAPISDQRMKYEQLCARIAVGKASQQDAIDAIQNLCADNERLAVITGKRRAALDEAEARAVKSEAERDAANALLREARSGLCAYTGGASGACEMSIQRIDAHLGAKP